MAKCESTGCPTPPRYLLRLRSPESGVHSEWLLCPDHYKVATEVIDEVAPDAECTISGYVSTQPTTVH